MLMLTAMMAVQTDRTKLGASPVKAYDYASMQYGNLNDTSQPPGEWYSESDITWVIANYMFPPSGNTWLVEDWYNFDSEQWPILCSYSTFVYNKLLFIQESYIPTDNLWVGDFNTQISPWSGARHWTFFGNPGSSPQDYAWDGMIGYCNEQYTGSEQVFDFIWTCSAGGYYWYWNGSGLTENLIIDNPNYNNVYGYWDSNNDIVGMPIAWTGRTDMPNGYSDPDSGATCYIGFEGSSRSLVTIANNNTGADYYEWLWYFYNYATGGVDNQHHTVNECLNYASYQIWGESYDGCPLDSPWLDTQFNSWCRMRVFGNGNYYIPW